MRAHVRTYIHRSALLTPALLSAASRDYGRPHAFLLKKFLTGESQGMTEHRRRAGRLGRDSRNRLLGPRATLATGGAQRDNPRETLFNVGRTAKSYELLPPRTIRITRCSHAGCEHAPRARHRAGPGLARWGDDDRRSAALIPRITSSRLAALQSLRGPFDFSWCAHMRALPAKRGDTQ